MARTVRDIALLLGVVAGPDPRDGTSSRRSVADFLGGARASAPAATRRGSRNFTRRRPSRELGSRACRTTTIERLHATVELIRVPDPEVLAGSTNVIVRCESAAIHTRGSSGSARTSSDGRPVAFQIVGRPFAAATILHLGTPPSRWGGWHALRPPID